ncbi:hypothetical protein, partial [Mesorhizobium sp.]|uniref:hypothetical protein n=1 Tax=Mesorhizobium sp. TaxID=1871066 RepID=UPI00257F4D74
PWTHKIRLTFCIHIVFFENRFHFSGRCGRRDIDRWSTVSNSRLQVASLVFATARETTDGHV